MSNRLNKEREIKLQPERVQSCKNVLEKLGFAVERVGDTELRFSFKEHVVKFFPYSGWHSGKTIKDGRGFNNLLKQIK